MVELSVGLVTAFMLGFLLWGGKFALATLSLLLLGGACLRSRGGRVMRDIGNGLYIVFGTCVMTLFLYYINRGIFRWFLCAAVLLSFFLCARYIGRYITPPASRGTERTRHIIGQGVMCVATPFYRIARRFLSLFRCMGKKMTLPIRRKYDKIKLSYLDRKKRKRLERTFMTMVRQMRRDTEHEH